MARRAILTIATHDKYLRRYVPAVTQFHGRGRVNAENTQRDLTDTLLATNTGVGLAAPQIGISARAIAYRVSSGKVEVLFNPKVLSRSVESTKADEMCLSIPGFVAKDVERAARVVVVAQNVKGVRQTVSFADYGARVIQHEIDHLDGKLIADIVAPENLKQTSYVGEVDAMGELPSAPEEHVVDVPQGNEQHPAVAESDGDEGGEGVSAA